MAAKYINTQCKNCRYYTPIESTNQIFDYDGICRKGNFLNGKKIGETARVKEVWGNGCRHWEHHKWGITHFEAKCHVPEAKRSEAEIEYLGQFIEWRDRSEWPAR